MLSTHIDPQLPNGLVFAARFTMALPQIRQWAQEHLDKTYKAFP